jgi:hypothetical protein
MPTNTPTTPDFSFGTPVDAPVRPGGGNSAVTKRRAVASELVAAAAAAIGQLADGKELPVNIANGKSTGAQFSRAINDVLPNGGHDGPFYARYDKASDQVRICKGKRPVRKSAAKASK